VIGENSGEGRSVIREATWEGKAAVSCCPIVAMFKSAVRPIARGLVRSMASTTHAAPGLSIGGGEVHGFVGAVGNTPLIRLAKLSDETGCNILAKAEFMSPGGSIKDRAALFLVKDAEAKGTLKPGGTVVEGTAGNTGIGLAHVCRSKGYRCVIYMPDTQVSRGAPSDEYPERSEKSPSSEARILRGREGRPTLRVRRRTRERSTLLQQFSECVVGRARHQRSALLRVRRRTARDHTVLATARRASASARLELD
jgi:hypothetical protein